MVVQYTALTVFANVAMTVVEIVVVAVVSETVLAHLVRCSREIGNVLLVALKLLNFLSNHQATNLYTVANTFLLVLLAITTKEVYKNPTRKKVGFFYHSLNEYLTF
jgi:hypothetical protein